MNVVSPLAFLHTLGARVLLLFAVAIAIWGTYQYFRKAEISAGFRSSYLIMAAVTAVQGLLGLAAFATGGHPRTLLHLVYGVFAAVFVPGAYLWARSGNRRREAVILAGASWVVSIAFFRGIATG
jgi:CDP-diglyceride synthetase